MNFFEIKKKNNLSNIVENNSLIRPILVDNKLIKKIKNKRKIKEDKKLISYNQIKKKINDNISLIILFIVLILLLCFRYYDVKSKREKLKNYVNNNGLL